MASRFALFASIAAALVALVASLVPVACGPQSSACGAPSTDVYDCQPLALDAGVPGCVGGPWVIGVHPDQDKLFPGGCRATVPSCSPINPVHPEVCECEPNQLLDGGLSWICPVE
jgi:hypothetical protein